MREKLVLLAQRLVSEEIAPENFQGEIIAIFEQAQAACVRQFPRNAQPSLTDQPPTARAGTTATLFLRIKNNCWIINLGDSRTIVYDRDNKWLAASEDHGFDKDTIVAMRKQGYLVDESAVPLGGSVYGGLHWDDGGEDTFGVSHAFGHSSIVLPTSIELPNGHVGLLCVPDVQGPFAMADVLHVVVCCDGVTDSFPDSSKFLPTVLEGPQAWVKAAYEQASSKGDNISLIHWDLTKRELS